MTASGGSARSAHLRRRTSRLAVGPRRRGLRSGRRDAVRTAVGVGCLLAAVLGGMYASFSLAALLWFAPLVICALIALPTRRHRIAAAWLAPLAFGWIGALIALASACGLIGLSLMRRLAHVSAPYLAAIRDEERNTRSNLR